MTHQYDFPYWWEGLALPNLKSKGSWDTCYRYRAVCAGQQLARFNSRVYSTDYWVALGQVMFVRQPHVLNPVPSWNSSVLRYASFDGQGGIGAGVACGAAGTQGHRSAAHVPYLFSGRWARVKRERRRTQGVSTRLGLNSIPLTTRNTY